MQLNMAVTKCVSAYFIFIWKTLYLMAELQRWFVNTMMNAHYILFICLFLALSELSSLLALYTMVVLTNASVTTFSDENRCL